MKAFIHKMKSRKWNSFVPAARRIQSVRVYFFALAALGAVCINTPLRADSINNPLYDVTGTMTISGNPVCGGAPCSETINFSLIYGYNYALDLAGVGHYYAYATPIAVTSFGDLGSAFTYSGLIGNPQPAPPTGCGGPIPAGERAIIDANYMPFSSGGTEIDLNACGNILANPVAPLFQSTVLYSCGTASCVTDFTSETGDSTIGIFLTGTVQTTVTAVPEGGSMLSYLLISLAPIGLAMHLIKRNSARTSTVPSL